MPTQRAAAQRSMDCVHAKKREDWIANFAEDAHVEDPIGKSMLDPTGAGHRGRAAIAAFWDRVIAPNRVMFEIRHSYACGDECANVGTINVNVGASRYYEKVITGLEELVRYGISVAEVEEGVGGGAIYRILPPNWFNAARGAL